MGNNKSVYQKNKAALHPYSFLGWVKHFGHIQLFNKTGEFQLKNAFKTS